MKPSSLNNGDVVLVTFPFTDLTSSKLRPAAVVSSNVVCEHEEDYTLLFISSVIPESFSAYEVSFPTDHADFKQSGLKKESIFKANKVATLQKKLIRKRIGRLGDSIRKELKTALEVAIDL